jgi:hypothetical protein
MGMIHFLITYFACVLALLTVNYIAPWGGR